ncbi:MAG: bifunctional metallophosphatase/5'-nucleotidase [Polyangiaceae bacterium]|nr:bifunctional metallophosphatase/5'-nucleotidase [Polyangiaceae bacterium]
MRPVFAAVALLVACAQPPPPPPAPPALPAAPSATAPARDRVISIVGTNDLHGHVEHLEVFAGYVARLRELRRHDGGVALVDAGDMFQGTLESNLGEGQAVISAFNALGYTAAALGNHDFDYGPVGERDAPGGDPRGALRARLAEARFPMLSANLIEKSTGRAPSWGNLHPSTLVEVGGVKLGIVGVITRETPQIVMPAHFAGLDVTPLAPAIAREAAALRRRGARAVVALAHAGGVCSRHDDPKSASACNADEELNQVARALPAGTVDAMIGGHTHQGVAHYFSGTAVAEAFALGRAFSRIDLTVFGDPSQRVEARVFPPQHICSDDKASRCTAGDYEGGAVRSDPRIRAAVETWQTRAAERRAEKLGVQVLAEVRREYGVESPLGNLLADLLLAASPGSDVAILNGGGLRAALPAGSLTYGQLYESQPFDNRVARLRLTGAELKRVIGLHLERGRHGIISLGGARLEARCVGSVLEVVLRRPNAQPIADTESVTIVTSDYLATGGDELFAGAGRPAPPAETSPETVRDALARELRKRGGSLGGEAPTVFDPKKPRVRLPGPRPVRCPR